MLITFGLLLYLYSLIRLTGFKGFEKLCVFVYFLLGAYAAIIFIGIILYKLADKYERLLNFSYSKSTQRARAFTSFSDILYEEIKNNKHSEN